MQRKYIYFISMCLLLILAGRVFCHSTAMFLAPPVEGGKRTISNSIELIFSDQSVSYVDQTKIAAGIVRKGFLKPGLHIISNDDMFSEIVRKIDAHNLGPVSIFTDGFYFNETYKYYGTENVKKLYSEVFQLVRSHYSKIISRFIILNSNATEEIVLHEILHDVIETSIATRMESFENFCYFMLRKCGESKRFHDALEDYAGIDISFAKQDGRYKLKKMKEFIAYIFAGMGRANTQYDYLKKNMPKTAKKHLYEVGFIWQDDDIIAREFMPDIISSLMQSQ